MFQIIKEIEGNIELWKAFEDSYNEAIALLKKHESDIKCISLQTTLADKHENLAKLRVSFYIINGNLRIKLFNND